MRNPGDGKAVWQERLRERSSKIIRGQLENPLDEESTDNRKERPAGYEPPYVEDSHDKKFVQQDKVNVSACKNKAPYFVAKLEMPGQAEKGIEPIISKRQERESNCVQQTNDVFNAPEVSVEHDGVTQSYLKQPTVQNPTKEEHENILFSKVEFIMPERPGRARALLQKKESKDATQNVSVALEMYEWLESCVMAVMVILIVFTFFVRSATVSGSSMFPTLKNGERLILQQIGYSDPQYDDIVVIDRTQNDEPPIIKRVIGKEGDIIDIDFTQGLVWRNGEPLEEEYTNEPTLSKHDVEFPLQVPEGCLFVMGDNRNASADSRVRSIGMIDIRRVMGKAIFRFMPLHEIGGIE